MSEAEGLAALRADLAAVNDELQGIVERSMALRAGSTAARQAVDGLWEEFLGNFLTAVKRRGREQGQNLFGGLSFSRILARS